VVKYLNATMHICCQALLFGLCDVYDVKKLETMV